MAAQTMTDPPPSLTPGSKNTVGRAAFYLGFLLLLFFLALRESKPNKKIKKQFFE